MIRMTTSWVKTNERHRTFDNRSYPGVASIGTGVGGQYLQSGSGIKFWLEKIFSRSLGMAAVIMLVVFGVKAMT